MKTFAFAATLVAISSASGEEKIRFVSTLTDLRAITEAVGGDLVEGSALCAGRQDPHFVDPKPTFLVRLREAELFVVNGLDLEIGWVPPLLDGARNPRLLRGAPGHLDASKSVPVLEIPAAGTTRAEGDVHPFGNPHYLLDPLNGLEAARAIAAKLRELRPASAEQIAARLRSFEKRLHEALFGADLVAQAGGEKLERLARSGELESFLQGAGAGAESRKTALGGWLRRAQPLQGQPVVAYHRNFSYLAQRFGFRVIGFVEPKPGIPPSPHHVADLAEAMKKAGATKILTHAFYDEQVPRHLAEKTGARAVVLPAAVEGVPEAKDYISFFDAILDRLTEQKP